MRHLASHFNGSGPPKVLVQILAPVLTVLCLASKLLALLTCIHLYCSYTLMSEFLPLKYRAKVLMAISVRFIVRLRFYYGLYAILPLKAYCLHAFLVVCGLTTHKVTYCVK